MNFDVIEMTRGAAREHYHDYRRSCAKHRAKRRDELERLANEAHAEAERIHVERTRIEKEDEELLKAYRALYRGQRIIDLPKTIADGGLDERKLPKLAACRADAEKCYLRIKDNAVHFMPRNVPTWHRVRVADSLRFSARMPAELTNAYWRQTQPVRYPNEAVALVPIVPPRLRPDDLSKYVILWEAEWTAKAPVDPLLLSRVNETLYAIVAQWDLTPLEQRVLEGRL